jgi:CheY-like chemotaxis protein
MLKILIAEDLADNREILAMLLETLGHEVTAVEDGPSVLRKATNGFDLILLDIGMPGLNGYEVASRLKNDPNVADVPLFALTGYATASDRDKALASGFQWHLAKPFRIEQFEEALKLFFPALYNCQ